MFEILIIEDNPGKLREILQLLSKIEDINTDKIDCEIDALGAKHRLQEKSYDLLILDIAIPLRKSEEVDLEGGLKLLKELQARSRYKIPTHIFGLTGRDDMLEVAQKTFEEKILSVIYYSDSNIEWQTKLLEGVRQRIASKNTNAQGERDYDYDVAIGYSGDTDPPFRSY